MKIDPTTHKVDPESLMAIQAEAFIVFLESEVLRHVDDIVETRKLIGDIKGRFGWDTA